MEISSKSKIISKLSHQYSTMYDSVLDNLSILDRIIFKFLFNKNIAQFVSTVQDIHQRKLLNLGITIPKFHNNNNVIFNFSDHQLTNREELLLSFGLDFCLPCFKPSYCQFFGALESVFSRLISLKLPLNTEEFRSHLHVLAHKTFNNLTTSWTPFFKKQDLDILRNLSKLDNIIISKPDKGRGLVLLNCDDYIKNVLSILILL